jgi:glutamate N-acetyltransferase/amino-acid N-acetyltransferase
MNLLESEMSNELPLGYQYSAVYAGIRKTAKDDLALILSDTPANAAAVFTRNLVAAAPVVLSRANLKASRGKVKALLINAGNANCATRTGARVAAATVKATAKLAACHPTLVLPSSTGVIGVELDPKKITSALPALFAGLSPGRFGDVARAIMTTDLVPKTAQFNLTCAKGKVRIAGMTKGSGMIHPNMATTLGYILTDADVPTRHLQTLLARATELSYNRLTVDGDTSTNDTLVLMANGASKVKLSAAELVEFAEAVHHVARSLAMQIARDGEGARKLVRILVSGAKSEADADRIGRAIANSPLVKTAIAGSDANWGRILCAAGYSGAAFDPTQVDIYLQGKRVCRNGLAAPFNEAQLKAKLDEKDVVIDFRLLTGGPGSAEFFTCDLTEGYIEINGSYRT